MTTTSKLLALSFAAALLSAPFAVSASAATSSHAGHATTRATRHHTVKPAHSTRRAARATNNPDNSADALNAQSLARSQGQQ
jgi:hypothetical protein